MTWQTILAIGSGGFLGAVLRGFINITINSKVTMPIPLSTISVNIIGSFLIGILFAFFQNTDFFSEYVKSFLVAGFLGALTTYSTFAIETLFLINTNIYYALLNMSINLFGTILASYFGFKFISMVYTYWHIYNISLLLSLYLQKRENMLKDFNKLHTFLTVVKEKSFSNASRKLGISQPAVTQQIKSIEDYLDAKLVDRKKSGIKLTKSGEQLLYVAQKLERAIGVAESALFKIINKKVVEVSL